MDSRNLRNLIFGRPSAFRPGHGPDGPLQYTMMAAPERTNDEGWGFIRGLVEGRKDPLRKTVVVYTECAENVPKDLSPRVTAWVMTSAWGPNARQSIPMIDCFFDAYWGIIRKNAFAMGCAVALYPKHRAMLTAHAHMLRALVAQVKAALPKPLRLIVFEYASLVPKEAVHSVLLN